MSRSVLIVALVFLIGEHFARGQECIGKCVKKDECMLVGSTDVVVVPTLPITPVGSIGVDFIDLRLDEGCDRLETCCNERDIIPSMPKDQSSFEQCGVRNLNGIGYRLVGNKAGVSEYGEFPWTLMVLRSQMVVDIVKEVYVCGASLIAPNLAITAAHCVTSYKTEKFYVRAGEWDTNTDKELFATQTRDIIDVIIHENYNKYHHNNIALLKIDTPFNADKNIQTICLPPPNASFNGQECFTGAWGKDKFDQGKLQNILRRVEVPVVPHEECQNAFRSTRLGPHFVLDDSYICAGGEENVDVCTGDGGAPLVCAIAEDSSRYYQVGIVAWGIGCGQKGIPGAYTDVARFVPWIYNNMDALGVNRKTSTFS
ncbi:phenoloxidase-activating factor 2-like [Topomyia yanbarensis]|uniref:phenoloxidase-activating factor 2-like n=1 Tax=Topomyia yanbarensis TaxID=2498891 RepID=UPI00273CDEEB|nr:phenoloxidase-activating factor 2-like [Topomyia yanbarensis]XP_058829784.1 phenoloxidase-activating factor 2-like [Topomyia yanbarensis]